jgi:segregation and condensation protein B
MLALSAIAYQQPITRAELSRLAGHNIRRDILGRLKSLGVVAPGPRGPEPGAPIAWVTTQRFLEVFALGSLRHLPDLDTLEDAGALGRDVDDGVEVALDAAPFADLDCFRAPGGALGGEPRTRSITGAR